MVCPLRDRRHAPEAQVIRRFLPLAAVLATVLAFYAIAPTPGDGRSFGLSVFDRVPAVAAAFEAQQRLGDTLRAVTFALQRQVAWETARAIPAGSASSDFVVLPGVPADIAKNFEQRAREQFARYPQPRTPLRVVIDVAGLETFGYRKHTVLPETEAQPCVVIVGISPKARSLSPADGDRLLGACGFYARFGRPGEGMLQWLEESRGVSASIDTSEGLRARRRTPRKFSGAEIGYSAPEAACLAGRDEGCAEAILDPFGLRTWKPIAVPSEQAIAVIASSPSSGLSWPGNILANLRAHVGDARFQEIWSSSERLDQAYETATGEPIAVFARKLLLLDAYPHKPGPLRGGLPLLLGLGIGLSAAVWAITRTRRERSGT